MALLIIGAGGFAREAGLVVNNSENVSFVQEQLFYLSDNADDWGKTRAGGEVVGSIEEFALGALYLYPEDLDRCIHRFIVAVGSPSLKVSLVARARKKHWEPFPFIRHEQSFLGDAHIGDGTIICSMCSITTNVTIGDHVNVNLNCTIGHDVIINDYVNLSPHCTISGNVHIKKGADLGSAVTVLPGVTIGENSIIGAGAVVNKDIPDNVVAVGLPAKVIKEL